MDEELYLDDDQPGVSMETDGIRLEGEEGTEPEAVNPLGFDMEQAPRVEMNAILQGFKSRSEREDQRVLDATDSEYWVALCFQRGPFGRRKPARRRSAERDTARARRAVGRTDRHGQRCPGAGR